MDTKLFLTQQLRSYYAGHEVKTVPEIASREFGIGEFGRKISSRHLSFRSASELNQFLHERAPFYISYSNALYKLPSARPMENKHMLGADLIYEFDADEIKTECKLSHDSWKCSSRTCLASGKGRLQLCPECGCGAELDEWVCPECLSETAKQSTRLISFLRDDFGLFEGIAVNFSGSKGFHIHVRGNSVRGLSKPARLELLDYITAANLDMAAIGFFGDFDFKGGKSDSKAKNSFICPKKRDAKGWAKRILDGVLAAFEENDVPKIAVMGGITTNKAELLLKDKNKIIRHIENGVLAFPTKGIDANNFWRNFTKNVVDEEKIEFGRGLEVDRHTSMDINKIIRVPNTIHGSTGLLAKEFQVEKLNSFEPLKDAVVFPENEIKIQNVVAPRFYLKGKWFGPFSAEEVSLPLYAAFYLLARGSASLLDSRGVGH